MSDSETSDGGDRVDPQTAFAELGRLMLANLPLEQVLQQIAELARRAIREVDHVSVTLMNGDRPRTAVFTGPVAMGLDERQYEAGYGPCTDAAVSGRTIIVDNYINDGPYPDFSAAARKVGIAQTVSVGLPVPDRVIGGMNLYTTTTTPLDPSTVELAQVFAGYAAVALMNAAQYSSIADLAQKLQEAVKSRSVIELAKGILMARDRSSAGRAFDTLLQMADEQGRQLREVAQSIVDGIQDVQK